MIGHVEILRARIYPLDAECRCDTGSTVVVEPGKYPLYRDGAATFWVMRGRLNRRGIWRMGDGMFGMSQNDQPSGIEVEFPSRRFGPDEWADLLASPEFTEGNKAQRIRVTTESVYERKEQ
jgi:hypothetical protein